VAGSVTADLTRQVTVHSFWKRRLLHAGAIAAVLSVGLASAQAQRLPETSVKAAFVARFAEFVEWPAAAHLNQPAVVLCLTAAHPFGPLVQQLTRDAVVRGRPVAVRELKQRASPRGCHLLFVAPADREVLVQVEREPILTVGDQPDFCPLGGIVNLLVVEGRVRFEINLAHARKAGLKIDPQLLRLAAAVHGGAP